MHTVSIMPVMCTIRLMGWARRKRRRMGTGLRRIMRGMGRGKIFSSCY